MDGDSVSYFVGNIQLETQGHKNVRFIGDDVWEINKPIKAVDVNSKKIYGYFPYCRERYLQRIDDDSETEDGESSVKEIERED